MADKTHIDYWEISEESQIPPPKPVVKEFRFFLAYVTTFRIIFSYLWLFFMRRLRGMSYFVSVVDEVNKRNAKIVQETLSRLQGLFIKVGQLISIMTNILPSAYREELEKLQDKITPRPFEEISRRIKIELGEPPEKIFASFDKKPIASASIAQVHRATLKTGEEVAVKVQHWEIERIAAEDLSTIKKIMKIIRFFFPIQGIEEYHQQIKQMIDEELDFSKEASNIEAIRKNFEGNSRIHFPKVFPEYSTKRVLTTSFIKGYKITDVEALKESQINLRNLAELVLTTYCQMIFIDGLYHADPHPGNILVHEDGSITFLDFGAVASLSKNMKAGIPEFLEGLIRRNTSQILKALDRMGFIARTGSEETSEMIIQYFHRQFLEEINLESLNLKDIKVDPEIGIKSLLDLSKFNIGIRELTGTFRVPKEWVLLERCILLLFGLVYFLDPELNPTMIIYPYLKDFVLGKEKNWQGVIIESLKEAVLSYLTLADDFRKVLEKIRKGEVKIQIKGADARAKYAHSQSRQYIYTTFAVVSWATALYFHSHDMLIASGLSCAVCFFFMTMLFFSSIYSRRFKKHL